MIKRIRAIKIIVGILIAFGLFAGYKYQIRSYQKRLVNVREKYWEKQKEDSLALIVKAKVNKELRDLYLSSTRMEVHWKNEYFKIKSAKQETLYVDSLERLKVSFDTTTACVKIEGITLTSPPEAFIEITNIPDILSIELGYIDKEWVVGKIKSERNCIIPENVTVEIPPDLNLDNFNRGPGTIKLIGAFALGAFLTWLIAQ